MMGTLTQTIYEYTFVSIYVYVCLYKDFVNLHIRCINKYKIKERNKHTKSLNNK